MESVGDLQRLAQHGLRLKLVLTIDTAPRDPYHDLRTSPTGGQGYVGHEL